MTHDQHSAESELAAALRLHARGELELASAAYESLLASRPESGRLLTQLGLLRMQQKRLPDAALLLERAIAASPQAAEAHAWHGEVLRRQGATQAAIAELQLALDLQPTFAAALFNLGLALSDREDYAAARTAWLRFLDLRPDDARIRSELGRLAYSQRDYAGAATWFAQQLARFPADADAGCDLATTLLAQNAFAQASRLLAPMAQRSPRSLRAETLLGQALLGEGRRGDALDTLLRATTLDPTNAEATYQAGRAFDQMARLDEAIEWFARAAALGPNRADIRNALAVAYLNFGDHARAVQHLREAIAIKPEFREAHSNLLIALHYIDAVDPEQLFAEHLRWAERHARSEPGARDAFANTREVGRRLRIGYVSPRFCTGPLTRFFLPLLEAHDRSRFHLTCYAVSREHDGATDLMRSRVDMWCDGSGLDDDALAQRVREDRVDILVDLVGHCPGNRLGVFARRAAPIQVTWLDYVDTTGLSTMDYLLTDGRHTPDDGSQHFTETVIRLPGTRLCYRPPDLIPPLATVPRVRRGYVTFGCFNRLSKLGEPVLRTWAQIMARVPTSRLVLKSTAFAAASTRAAVAARFSRYGVEPTRLELRPYSGELQMMAEYNDIDIALDPFPYNGCTTTCDALSMGVPVVALAGTTLSGRQGVALLGACALQAWIARSPREYVDIACNAAAADGELEKLRVELRPRFLASAVCDRSRFARDIEDAYAAMWTRWCAQAAPPS